MRTRRKFLFAALGAAALAASGLGAAAEAFPKGPVRLIVPFSPGGPTDTIARLVGQKLEEIWGQPVVIDFKPGGGTVIGIAQVARSPADGYTLGIVAPSYTINPVLRRQMPYDTVQDLRGVSILTTFPLAIVAHPGEPFDDLKGMIEYAKKHPGKLSYATPGVGGTSHLLVELLNGIAGIDLLHVPYKGSAPGRTDVIAGRVPLMCDPLFSAMPFVTAGKLKVIAVTTRERAPGFEQFPSVAETYPGFDVRAYLGFVVPKATPDAVVRSIQQASATALRAPEVRKRVAELGNTPVGSTPEAFDAFIAADMAKWAKVIRDARIPLE
ncbi:MAG: tripartite tricarboxylate transporter substrate binding protein [Burkholderiales bacterium]|nr:tripartite tricarboxylate transporter substrate binding protein [Burkholderiales bacterium]